MKKTDEKPVGYKKFFEKYIDEYKCPFFFIWLLKQSEEILKTEPKVKRKGLPKTGPRPMSRNKQLLALTKTLPKFKLKDFAEYSNVSYGVVRLWNRELQVEEKARVFMILFAIEYIEELEKRAFSKKTNIEEYSLKTTIKAHAHINSLLYEVEHYSPFIKYLIVDLIEDKVETLPDDKAFRFRSTALLLLSIMSGWTIFNPPKDKKEKDSFEQEIKLKGELYLKLTRSLFSDLKKMIKSGDTKKALRLSDLLEDHMLTKSADNTDLAIRILNKGRPKGEIKREKTA